MKALIKDGVVVDTAKVEFSVHSSMQWVECDDSVKNGYVFKNKKFEKPPEIIIEEDEEALKPIVFDSKSNKLVYIDKGKMKEVPENAILKKPI